MFGRVAFIDIYLVIFNFYIWSIPSQVNTCKVTLKDVYMLPFFIETITRPPNARQTDIYLKIKGVNNLENDNPKTSDS